MRAPTVLYIDDQPSARDLFERQFEAGRFRTLTAPGVREAEEIMRQEAPDVVVTDLRMPDLDGLEGLARFHAVDPDLPVVLITAFGSVETAVEAMKRGAFDYVRKPYDAGELEIVIDRALRHRGLVAENARLRSQVARQAGPDDIICRSAVMRGVLDLVTRVAASEFSVLIQGESGTGKDLLARRVHQLSRRASRAFVSLNCSAIPEHLLESELFGHEKGAFSGATASRPGFFSEADGGTLFLDEIGDLSLGLQPKLLRVLQSGEFYRVGSRRLTRTDVRLVSASNRNLEELVAEGRFRPDLYYRINAVRVVLPPLRDRVEDIPLLAEHFLERIRAKNGGGPSSFHASAMRVLLEYAWPGNVRELEHAIERASLVADGPEIRAEGLPPELRGKPREVELTEQPYKEARRAFERRYFEQLLSRAGGSVQRAAELAGLHRSTLYDKLAALGLHVEHGED